MDCRDNRQHRIRHQQVAPFYSGAMARIYSGVDNHPIFLSKKYYKNCHVQIYYINIYNVCHLLYDIKFYYLNNC